MNSDTSRPRTADDAPAFLRTPAHWLRVAPRSLAIVVFGAWCTLIFVLSGQPSPELGHSFRPLRAWAHNTLHAPEFAVFMVLFLWATSKRGVKLTVGHRRIFWAVIVVLIYASSDEWHQSFTPGRDSSVCDVLTDVCGGTSAALFLRAIEEGFSGARILRIVFVPVLACALAALIATFLPSVWPNIGWL